MKNIKNRYTKLVVAMAFALTCSSGYGTYGLGCYPASTVAGCNPGCSGSCNLVTNPRGSCQFPGVSCPTEPGTPVTLSLTPGTCELKKGAGENGYCACPANGGPATTAPGLAGC